MPLSMAEIAKRAGTSRATVSHVLTGQWKQRRITEATYRRVRKVAEQWGYRPNFLAKSLVSGKTGLIGVQFPSFLYDHWSSILKEVEIQTRLRDHRLLLSMPASYQDEQKQIEMLIEHQVDGLILAPLRARRLWRVREFLDREKKPCVFLGNSPGPKYYSVVDDNSAQAGMALRHLIKLGHTRIAQLVGTPANRSAVERYVGYRKALDQAGIAFVKPYVRTGELTCESAFEQTKALLAMKVPPTAIYCAADILAVGAIEAVETAGLRVPNDIAVVGHADDLPFKSFQRIPLTTVRQPREELARQSVAMLFEIMQGKVPRKKYVQLDGELIVRKSCGA